MPKKEGLIPKKISVTRRGKTFETTTYVSPEEMFDVKNLGDKTIEGVRKLRGKIEKYRELVHDEVEKLYDTYSKLNSTLDRMKEKKDKRVIEYSQKTMEAKREYDGMVAGFDKLGELQDSIHEEVGKRIADKKGIKHPHIEHRHEGRMAYHPIEEQHREKVQEAHLKELKERKLRPHEDFHRDEVTDYWHHEDIDHEDDEARDAHNKDLRDRDRLEKPWYSKLGVDFTEISEDHFKFESPRDAEFQADLEMVIMPDGHAQVGKHGEKPQWKFPKDDDALDFIQQVYEQGTLEPVKKSDSNGSEQFKFEDLSVEKEQDSIDNQVDEETADFEQVSKLENRNIKVTVLSKEQAEDGTWNYECSQIEEEQ